MKKALADGQINGMRIDSNSVTSMHKRGNIVKLPDDAIQSDSPSSVRVFYVDKEKASRWLNGSGLQLPRRKAVPDGFVHTIHESGSPVKQKLSSVFESKQFKNADNLNPTADKDIRYSLKLSPEAIKQNVDMAVSHFGTTNRGHHRKKGHLPMSFFLWSG